MNGISYYKKFFVYDIIYVKYKTVVHKKIFVTLHSSIFLPIEFMTKFLRSDRVKWGMGFLSS